MKAETGNRAHWRTHRLPGTINPDTAAGGAGRIFDHWHTKMARYSNDTFDCTRHANLMHRQHRCHTAQRWCGVRQRRFGQGCQRSGIAIPERAVTHVTAPAQQLLKKIRIEIEALRLDIEQHRLGTAGAHCIGGSDKTMAHCHHHIAGTDADRL